MWKKYEQRDILKIITDFEKVGPPFVNGNYRTDEAAIKYNAISYSGFGRLFRYMQELEKACEENGIETETMRFVKRRPRV